MQDSGKLNIYFEKLLEAFKTNFEKDKNKKIVLYGIGAFSATVIEVLQDYCIIGLMDRDPDNIGRLIYGLPVLSMEQAEKEADMIIINTEAGYWQTIYKRIQNIKIPVYYRNGQKAYLASTPKCDKGLEYWNTSKQKLYYEIEKHSVISFDIFDTLITRKVFLPADVFQLVELYLKTEWKLEIDFVELRTKALHTTGVVEPAYEEIYNQFRVLSGLDSQIVEKIKQLELNIEKKLLAVRKDMVEAFYYAKQLGKQIILVSDMYYSSGQLEELLSELDIVGYKEIFVSCEYRKNKQSGQLYEEVFKKYDKNRLLHIGDNKHSDYTCMKEKGGADAFYIMSGRDLLANSSIKEIVPHICTIMDSLVIGMIVAKLLNSPFELNETKGFLYYDEADKLGYGVFAPLVFGFTHWLWQSAMNDKVEKILFFSRDGYFLKEYFEQLQKYCNCTPVISSEYFMISRRLAAVAAIKKEADFLEVARLPYKGTFSEYMEKRWNVKIDEGDNWSNKLINTSLKFDELLDYMMKHYKEKLKNSIIQDKKNYKKYCISMVRDSDVAVVDTWYYGNCQWYLSQILETPVRGYYFSANLTNENRNNTYNLLSACYNNENNPAGNNVSCLKNSLHFESIFTAPHGMIRSCIGEDSFTYEPLGKNQQEFWLREKVNQGVEQFIQELVDILGKDILCKRKINYEFCDRLYGICWDDNIQLSREIQSRLYNENYFQSSEEFLIIE